MKYQGKELSYYGSTYLGKQLGMLNAVKWIFFGLFVVFAFIFAILGIADDNYLIVIVGPIFCFLIFGFPMIYAFRKTKGMLKELNSRNLSSDEQANVQFQIKKAAKFQWILTVVMIAFIAVLFGSIIADSIPSSHNDNSEKCRNCGRKTDLVAGFDYCYDCYEGFVDWQEDNWTEA